MQVFRQENAKKCTFLRILVCLVQFSCLFNALICISICKTKRNGHTAELDPISSRSTTRQQSITTSNYKQLTTIRAVTTIGYSPNFCNYNINICTLADVYEQTGQIKPLRCLWEMAFYLNLRVMVPTKLQTERPPSCKVTTFTALSVP